MRLRRRARPREVVTQSTLDNAFDRRTFVIGTAMGGLGVLLAAHGESNRPKEVGDGLAAAQKRRNTCRLQLS